MIDTRGHPVCNARIHCVHCRDKQRGVEFRKSLLKYGFSDGGDTEFICQTGFQWGVTSKEVGVTEVVQITTSAAGAIQHSCIMQTAGPAIWNRIFAAIADHRIFTAVVLKEIADLPCKECKDHSEKYIIDFPIPQSGDLFEYAWRWKNAVNKKIGAKQITLEDARKIRQA